MHESKESTLGFFAGLSYPLRGMRFVFRTHRGLVRYWIVPVLITVLALTGLGAFVIDQRVEFASGLWAIGQGAPWYLRALHATFSWSLAIVGFAVGTLFLLLASNVIAAPFNDALSAAVERIEGTLPPSSGSISAVFVDLVRSIALESAKLVLYVVVMAPLFVLSWLLPVVGSPMSAFFGLLITVTYVAVDYTDWPASRRGRGLRARIEWSRQHAAPLLGFGVASWVLLFVPGLNLLLMPAAVVGGTLLYLDLEERQQREAG